jgi:sarcosine oxidase delta subunit
MDFTGERPHPELRVRRPQRLPTGPGRDWSVKASSGFTIMINTNRTAPRHVLEQKLNEAIDRVFSKEMWQDYIFYRAGVRGRKRLDNIYVHSRGVEVGPMFGKVHAHIILIITHWSRIGLNHAELKAALEEVMDLKGIGLHIRHLKLDAWLAHVYAQKGQSLSKRQVVAKSKEFFSDNPAFINKARKEVS